MKIFYCQKCNVMEILSDNTIEVQHTHHSPNIIGVPAMWMRDRLIEIDPQGPMSPSIRDILEKNFVVQIKKELEEKYSEQYLKLAKSLNSEIAKKAMQSFHFKEGQVYMMLVDPSMIDVEALATIDMSDFPAFNVVFIPVRIQPGKTIEDAVIYKETVEHICDWLGKTMRCKILLLPLDEDADV